MSIFSEAFTQVVTPPCWVCGEASTVEVDSNAYRYWKSGELLIQDAFPGMSAGQREMLKTGIHPSCWDSVFSDEEDLED